MTTPDRICRAWLRAHLTTFCAAVVVIGCRPAVETNDRVGPPASEVEPKRPLESPPQPPAAAPPSDVAPAAPKLDAAPSASETTKAEVVTDEKTRDECRSQAKRGKAGAARCLDEKIPIVDPGSF